MYEDRYKTQVPNRSTVNKTFNGISETFTKKTFIGIILLMALVAFEMFNFDTTRYALRDLLGDVRFWGVGWASILAIAFCAIDFAGLSRLFTPERGHEEPKAVWYLTGAWLLGATMNAIMTWWAVSLTLLSHELGNEVLSREQLLSFAPIFVATLVWLTRILFIGAFSVAGEHIFDLAGRQEVPTQSRQRTQTQAKPAQQRVPRQEQVVRRQPARRPNGIHRAPTPMHAKSRRSS